ncbi:hypothetical protein CFK41_08545 [Brachybacterium ginsengisoli]|uniref:Integral membrane protein n=1 Tax=Brachybacterium ginsengisoli TaxID=1331682 RepID=A0A291GX79_9MICO|nr:hypothetical protein [Brachybacterium ginsengisoli]ATG54809.1 hypothetical protein CFK41_08545 [Brachybacterium ginsengisoli]
MSASRPRSDRSSSSRGFEIVLIAVYGIFAISATARSLVQMLRDFSFAPVAYGLSFLAAVTYIAVTVALVRWGRRSTIARVLCMIELAGVLIVGTLTLLDPALFPDATVWGHFGQDYGFVPLLLPVVALLYMLRGRAQGVQPGRTA